jgi:hypothetical protein
MPPHPCTEHEADAHSVPLSKKNPVYILRVQSQRGDDIRRLRRLLKVLLRAHGWRCLGAEPEVRP